MKTFQTSPDSASPHHIQQHIREYLASIDRMTEDVEVILSGGTYYLDAPLVMTAADSGRDGHRVIWRSAEGERVAIYAGLPVIGWQPHDDHIYKAPLSRPIHTLYENGQRSVKARTPAHDYSCTEAIDSEPSQTQFRFKADDVPQIADVRNLQVYIWPGGPQGEWNWFTDIINIESVDFADRMVTLAKPARYVLGAGSRYFIMGALELLTEPGQFHYDPAAQMLYYWPRQTPIEDQLIIAPISTSAFVFQGSSWSDVASNITLKGLEIGCSDALGEFGGHLDDGGATYPDETGIIHLENAESITIDACKIHNTGMHGVFGNGWAQNIKVENCLVENIGFTGVLFNGLWRSIHHVNKNNSVCNCYIHHTGEVIGFGAGVQLTQSGGNTIRHNRIHHTPRYSISLKGPYPGLNVYQEVDGIHVREHNVASFMHTHSNSIDSNDVSHANTDSQDTGVIESWGTYGSRGNGISNNLIHDSDIPFSFGFGIYLDDAASNFMVRDNLIYNLNLKGEGRMWSVFYIKGVGNQFINNIAANCKTVAGTFLMHGMLNDPNRDMVFERNILYHTHADTTYGFRTWDEQKFKRADDNLFYLESGEYKLKGAPDVQTFDEWRTAAYRKHDQFSLTGVDPLFMDAANDDYRLRYDSPVRGFVSLHNFDKDNLIIGLSEFFPFADVHERLDRIAFSETHMSLRLDKPPVRLPGVSGRTVSGFKTHLNDVTIHYISSDPKIAAVDESGRVTPFSPGVALITATVTKNGVTKQTTLHVLVDDAFDRVEMIAPHPCIAFGQSMPLRAVGRTKFGAYVRFPKSLTFISHQSHIGMVDAGGLLTGVGVGVVEVEAVMLHDGVRKSGRISVQVGEPFVSHG